MNAIERLCALELSPHHVTPILGFTGDHTAITHAAWIQRVRAWQTHLQLIKDSSVILYHDDLCEFSAALCALWRLEKSVILPPNTLDSTLFSALNLSNTLIGNYKAQTQHTLNDKHNAMFVASPATTPATTAVATTATNITNNNTNNVTNNNDNTVIHPNKMSDDALIVFTSGSSGQPKPIRKTFDELELELGSVDSIVSAHYQHAIVTGSVSHQHIYGFIFKCLYPLTHGHPIFFKTLQFNEQLIDASCLINLTDRTQLLYVTSPAHLDNLAGNLRHRIGSSSDLHKSTPDVKVHSLSAGAPLLAKSAKQAQQVLGHEPLEIYGSSETGAIAWRQQLQHTDWTSFPSITLSTSQDNTLCVQRGNSHSETITDTRDLFTINRTSNRQHFSLHGRVDNIVKIAGKRMSLPQIEMALMRSTYIQKCRCIQLPAKNNRLGAVIQLSSEGRQLLIDQGKLHLNRLLSDSLKDSVEAVAYPRYWRYLLKIPTDTQGKHSQTALKALFEDSITQLPDVIEVLPVGSKDILASTENERKVILKLFIPSSIQYFDGHFPGQPILPGVTQTHWAIHYGIEYLGYNGEFTRLEAIKFQNVILGDTQVSLELTYHPSNGKLLFRYFSDSIAHSSGRIVFTQEAEHD